MNTSPVIPTLRVIPVAGRDGMLLNLSGAYALYLQHGLGARNDVIAMLYMISGWTFDLKRPCMLR